MPDLIDSLLLEDKNLADINEITRKIIGYSYTVSNKLGCGFLEKVYENALAHELMKNGLHFLKQHSINVFYDEIIVGEYIADLLVEDSVLVELNSVEQKSRSKESLYKKHFDLSLLYPCKSVFICGQFS